MSSRGKGAFIGLGVMGYPVAGHLAANGYDMTVYTRNPVKAESWIAEHPGTRATTPSEALKGAGFIFSCVGNDDDLRAVSMHRSLAGGPALKMPP
jgi:3-hydroxyisobutyrate dehydrogenase